MSLFQVHGLSYCIGSASILQDLTFQVFGGEILGIIGPNGSGKSTLLQAISGLLKVDSGTILFKGKQVTRYKKKQLAREIAVLEQEGTPPLDFSVEDVVALGRYPWLKPFGDLSSQDFDLVEKVLTTLDLWSKRRQKVNSLSGGERQLVALARAMVQEPQVLILDEPTTFLDIGHQMQVMEHVRRWHQRSGNSVIMVLHDLNLAAQYCDRLLLMEQGKLHTWGRVAEVFQEKTLKEVYNTDFVIINHPILRIPQILLTKEDPSPELKLVYRNRQ